MQKLPDRLTGLGPVLLLVVGIFVFFPNLRIIPSISDDVLMFSKVLRTPNPFMLFASDWGVGGNIYRPLVGLSFWLVYHVAGVSAVVNQGISVLCHFVVVLLLWTLMREVGAPRLTAFFMSGLTLLSMYTVIGTTLATDRGSIIVAIAMVLLLLHKVRSDKVPRAMNPLLVAFYCALALASKESGVVVLVLALALAADRSNGNSIRWRIITAIFATGLAYGIVRFLVFGMQAASYETSSINLGEKVAGLISSLTAVFFPVHSRNPGLEGFVRRCAVLVPTVALWLLVGRRWPNPIQKWCLLIIVLNALVHPYSFRYRFFYLPQIAFCLYVAASPLIRENLKIRRAVHITAALLMIYNVRWVSGHIQGEIDGRVLLVKNNLPDLKPYEAAGRVEPAIKEEILKYRVD